MLPFPENIKTRITPTPSGYLHIGNGFSFVLTWLIARAHQGKILLRIDDLDIARIRTEYLEDIFKTLDWLQLTYDEGPSSPSNFLTNYSQNIRVKDYLHSIKLLQKNENTFYCTCSRKDIKQNSADGQYPETCRNKKRIEPNKPYAIRITTPQDSTTRVADLQGERTFSLYNAMRDFVVLRKDGIPAYQIASLVDDVQFGINTIVRGEDLWLSSAAQVYLAEQLELHDFLTTRFVHHSTIKNEVGEKLSKTEGAISLKYLREHKMSPKKVYQRVANYLGLPKSAGESLQSLVAEVDFNKLKIS